MARWESASSSSRSRIPGEKMTVDEYYGWIFENSRCLGCPKWRRGKGFHRFEYMRRYGAFEVASKVGKVYEQRVADEELEDMRTSTRETASTRGRRLPRVPQAHGGTQIEPDEDGRRRVGVRVDGEILQRVGRRRQASWSSGRTPWPNGDGRNWRRPTYIKSHVHPSRLEPGQMPLISTFRVPVQIHTRSANAKWLDEIAHTNPLWIHPKDAGRLGIGGTGSLVRVTTDLGYFVVKAWITEGIRPGVVACSHHMGRWKPEGQPGQRLGMMTVALAHSGSEWSLAPKQSGGPFRSNDPDTMRVWWTDVGVHQNLTHAVHPDPVSGQHCWHQAVRVTPAEPGDRRGDVSVDTEGSRAQFERWLELVRPADGNSPGGLRRPWWMLRPVRPVREAYRFQSRQ